MMRAGTLIATILLMLALAGCGQSEEAKENLEKAEEEQTSVEEVASNEVVIGGVSIEGPNGREISIPETTVEREDVENYVQSVRPIIQDSARDLSEFIDPTVELQNQMLTMSIEAESLEEARAKVEDGLEALRAVEPPKGLEPVHELLIAAYVQALAAYNNMIQASESGDVDVLADAVQENLPEIEQFTAETRAILQEFERLETVNPDGRVESRG